MSKLFDKQVNAQKEKLPGLIPAPASPQKKCEMKMKGEGKKRRAPKIFLMEGRSFYKGCTKYSYHRYQTTSGQRFLIH